MHKVYIFEYAKFCNNLLARSPNGTIRCLLPRITVSAEAARADGSSRTGVASQIQRKAAWLISWTRKHLLPSITWKWCSWETWCILKAYVEYSVYVENQFRLYVEINNSIFFIKWISDRTFESREHETISVVQNCPVHCRMLRSSGSTH